jgi:hypothetical protein
MRNTKQINDLRDWHSTCTTARHNLQLFVKQSGRKSRTVLFIPSM